jgi:hypothetical protein
MLLFRHHVIKNLLAAGRISQTAVDIIDRFHHPGFSAYEGVGVSAVDSSARERLASYLVHAPFSLARLHYDRHAGAVTYEARASSRSHPSSPAPEQFTPLDALAALTAFIPEKGLQLARYYGFYSNKARGQRRRQDAPALNPMAASCPDAPQDDDFRRFCRRAWARLIRKVYLADPLTCPKCGGRLRILSFIDNPCVTSNSGFFPSARPRPGVQQHWNLTPIFLPGRPRNDYLTPSTDPAARRGGSRRQSKPGLKGMVRPAAGQKVRGEEPSISAGLFSSHLLETCPSYIERAAEFRDICTTSYAILLLPGKSKVLSTQSNDAFSHDLFLSWLKQLLRFCR